MSRHRVIESLLQLKGGWSANKSLERPTRNPVPKVVLTAVGLMLAVATVLQLGCVHSQPSNASLVGNWKLQWVEGDFDNLQAGAYLRFDDDGTYTARLFTAEKNSKLEPVAEWSAQWAITNGTLAIDTASPFEKTNLVTEFRISRDSLHFERDPLFAPWTSRSSYKRIPDNLDRSTFEIK